VAQRLDRIERVDKPAPVRGARHELRDALRAGAAHRARVEAALLPDDAREELDGKAVLGRVLFDRAADVVRGRWSRFAGGLLCRRRRKRDRLCECVRTQRRQNDRNQ
jgi:hypothetical protein